MNMHPWFLEHMAEYERDRIEHDIQQIRLEKKAMQASCLEENITETHSHRSRLLMRIALSFVQWVFEWAGKFSKTAQSKSEHRASGKREIIGTDVSDRVEQFCHCTLDG